MAIENLGGPARGSFSRLFADSFGITETTRPLNAYDLFGLRHFESDRYRIDAAIAQRRSVLESLRDRTDASQWSAIEAELLLAAEQLQDSDEKAILDASLRRGSNQGSAVASQAIPDSHLVVGDLKCPKCKRVNPPKRRFCNECGESLWSKCCKCGELNAAYEPFCGSCGVDTREELRRKEEHCENQLRDAERLRADHQYNLAREKLLPLAVLDDPLLETWIERAVTDFQALKAAQREAHKRVREAVEEGRRHMADHAFDAAITALKKVHPNLRTAEVSQLAAAAKQARDEILSLSGEIRAAVTEGLTGGVLPKLARLLILKPDHQGAKELAAKLRDQAVGQAQELISAGNYMDAVSLLEGIPVPFRRRDHEEIYQDALELHCLLDDVRNSPLADEVTLGLARRLAQAVPENREIQKVFSELQNRRQRTPTDPRSASVDWVVPPILSAVGPPVTRLERCTQLDSGGGSASPAHPGGIYFVAIGLALQALELAPVTLHYLPPPKPKKLFETLPMPFGGKNKHSPLSVWGLDLSDSGLKAIRLTLDRKSGAVALAAAEYFPHSMPLTHPAAKPQALTIIIATLREFVAKHATAKQDKIAAGLSGQAFLSRYLKLPPIPAAKLEEAVRLESRHQFPLPLEDLEWRTYINNAVAGAEADRKPRHILAAATPKHRVRQRESVFAEAGLPLSILQSDCLALHNAMAFEFFSKESDRLPDAARCVIDVGMDGTNVVISSPSAVWFRSFGIGTDHLIQPLIKNLNISYEDAVLLLHEPHRARRYSKIRDFWNPIFIQLTSEVTASIKVYRNLFPDRRIAHIHGVGGGFAVHGLLRHFRTGD